MILVTGGGGFLGGAIIRQLLARGESIRNFSRGDYPELRALGVDVRRGDLADASAVHEAVADCVAVIHAGALAGQWGSYNLYHQANVVGTQNIIAACRAHDVSKLVYTSSPSAIDDGQPIEGGDESLPYPNRYVSPYSATKAEGERLILAANDENLATVAIRPPLIWGPGDTQLVPRILERARSKRIFKIGDGAHKIDTTYIDNAAAAHVLALDLLAPHAAISGKVYFISNDEPLPTFEIINRIVGAGGYPPIKRTLPKGLVLGAASLVEGTYRTLRIKREPPLTRFQVEQLCKARWFDISAAKRDLGYQPTVSIDEGMQRLAASLQQVAD